jgi:hypothetical protein
MAALTLEQILALPYVTDAERLSLPRMAGLYCAVINRQTVGYVGVTTASLRQRWMSHHRRRPLLALGDVTIAYLEGNGLADTERDTIAALAPRLNVRDVRQADLTGRPAVPVSTTSGGLIRGSVQLTQQQYRWLQARKERLGLRSLASALSMVITKAMQ